MKKSSFQVLVGEARRPVTGSCGLLMMGRGMRGSLSGERVERRGSVGVSRVEGLGFDDDARGGADCSFKRERYSSADSSSKVSLPGNRNQPL